MTAGIIVIQAKDDLGGEASEVEAHTEDTDCWGGYIRPGATGFQEFPKRHYDLLEDRRQEVVL